MYLSTTAGERLAMEETPTDLGVALAELRAAVSWIDSSISALERLATLHPETQRKTAKASRTTCQMRLSRDPEPIRKPPEGRVQ
jgi:hypothetical protein